MEKVKLAMTVFLILVVVFCATACSYQNTTSKDKKTEQHKPSDVKMEKQSKSLPLKLQNPNISIFFTGEPNDAMDIVTGQFEEKFGGKVNYELATWNDRVAKITSLINGGSSPDVCLWSHGEIPKYMVNNVLQPIEEYFDLDEFLWDKNAMNLGRYKGKYYGIDNNVHAFLIYYNKTLFDNNGLKTPTEYYKEGKWNWETFRELAIKLTADTDGDGSVDQWGFMGRESPMTFVMANGADFVELEQDGSAKLNLSSPALIEALQFMQDSYVKDKFNNPNSQKWQDDFKGGKIAMSTERKVFASNTSLKENMKYEWDIVPFPNGPSGKKGVSPAAIAYWGIAIGAPNPTGGAAWIHLKKAFDNNEVDPGLATNFTNEQIKFIKEIEQNVQIERYTGFGTFQAKLNPLMATIKKGEPITSSLEKLAPVLQNEIDLTLKLQ